MFNRVQLNIRIVVFMAKLESPTLVRRQLQRQNEADVPTVLTITLIYNKGGGTIRSEIGLLEKFDLFHIKLSHKVLEFVY